MLTNTLNPKAALFFLVFFPQFISKKEMANPILFIVLGIIFAIMGVIWFLFLTYFSSGFSNRIKNGEKINKWWNNLSGIVFILTGIKIVLTKK